MTHYQVLGVAPSASVGEIRQAYLAAARRHHPDLQGDPDRRQTSEQRMQQVNAAWAVLGDSGRRLRYDRTLGLPEPGDVPHRPWTPVDETDDEVDPRDLIDDTPYGDGGGIPRTLQIAPPMLVLAALGCIIVGSFTSIPGLLVVGLVVGVVGGLLFLAVPFVAVFRGHRGGVGSVVDDSDG